MIPGTIGADPDSRDNGGETPLHQASRSGGIEALKVLLEVGADASATSDFEETVLDVAKPVMQDAIALLLRSFRRDRER